MQEEEVQRGVDHVRLKTDKINNNINATPSISSSHHNSSNGHSHSITIGIKTGGLQHHHWTSYLHHNLVRPSSAPAMLSHVASSRGETVSHLAQGSMVSRASTRTVSAKDGSSSRSRKWCTRRA